MIVRDKIWNLGVIFICVIVLLSKRYYTGPYLELVHSYLGNISISFAVYFILGFSSDRWKNNNFITAFIALLVVELFEITNGFGIMRNVFDYFDLIANILGVVLALTLNSLLDRLRTQSNKN